MAITKSFFLGVVLCWLPFAMAVTCDWALGLGSTEPGYTTDRELNSYDAAFRPPMGRAPRWLPSQEILRLGKSPTVIDVGAGEARVLRSLVGRFSTSARFLGLGLYQPRDAGLAQDLVAHPNFVYLSGQSFEARFDGSSLDAYKGQADLVVDVFGAGTYGVDPFATVVREAQLLAPDRLLFTMIPLRLEFGRHSQVLLGVDRGQSETTFSSILDQTADSIYDSAAAPEVRRHCMDWVKQIKGVRREEVFVTTMSGIEYLAIVLRRTRGAVSAPPWQLLEFGESIPPVRHLRWPGIAKGNH